MLTINGQEPMASRIIGGSGADLIRDAHDEPVSWLHLDRALRGHRSCFLVGRGWSATADKLAAIQSGPFLSAAINNYPRTFRPDIWITGDPPNYFGRWIWEDAAVQKFVPLHTADLPCPKFDVDSPVKTPKDYGNVHFYHHATNIDAGNFFATPYAAWGTTSYGLDDKDRPHGGVRSSMIAALRILYHLGMSTVYLLGCDFDPHGHPDPTYFPDLSAQFKELRPVFEAHDFNVMNTNRDSHLRCFDFMDFDRIANRGGQ